MWKSSSCPLAQQGHDACAEEDADHHEGEALVVLCAVRVEEEIAGQKLDEACSEEEVRSVLDRRLCAAREWDEDETTYPCR